MATSEDLNGTPPAAPVESNGVAENAAAEQPEGSEQAAEQAPDESLYSLSVALPHSDEKLSVMIYAHEQFSEVRQAIIESPVAQQYTCFHLEHKGARINEFIPVSEIPDLATNAEIAIVEDPYTEKEARLHFIRIRDLIGAAGNRPDSVQGVLAGLSLFDGVSAAAAAAAEAPPVEYDFDALEDLSTLLPAPAAADEPPVPKTVKALQVSPWNPPPVHLRQRGHLLYLLATTNEGEQFQITGHVGGFYVNKSSNTKFDPSPRPSPKGHAAHSLLALLAEISPSFAASFTALQEYNARQDPLSTFAVTGARPAAPWLVPAAPSAAAWAHSADITRTQEAYLIAGTDNVDNLRDWNEELQSARELPRDTVQDRIFRERLLAKVYADFVDAATRGALLVANGEVTPLNPTEEREAQIFVYNNIFFSYGADGVGTFTSEGGDEAARVATGKDVAGVRRVNQLDIEGLFSPGTVVVDYLGKRIVGQSLVPGIFKQREPGENQIDYGAVEGKDVVAADERFVKPFSQLSKALNVQRHAVWDKDGKRFELEGSVETKGLIGTDGRKYVLDLYRITPLDIAWLEGEAKEAGEATAAGAYPHRMTVLRPELVDIYYRFQMREWVEAKRAKAKEEAAAGTEDAKATEASSDKPAEKVEEPTEKAEADGDAAKAGEDATKAEGEAKSDPNSLDSLLAGFSFALNPDVFSGQVPQTEEEKAQLAADEQAVRAVCQYLQEVAIPSLLTDLSESEISFPMDGRSLSLLLHKRGINVRYLGRVAQLSAGQARLACLHTVAVREMVARAFKHVAATYLRRLPLPLTAACLAHLLNCLLGSGLNAAPTADVDPSLRSVYGEADFAFEAAAPAGVRAAVEAEVRRRFRFSLPDAWSTELRGPLQLLREVCLKLGIQVRSKEYVFEAAATVADKDKEAANGTSNNAAANGPTNGTNGVNGVNGTHSDGSKSKKKKKHGGARDGSPSSSDSETRNAAAAAARAPHTFAADDIASVVPVVRDSAPRSALAEEALEAGRISLAQGQRKIGQELLVESLSLHEQIYGILHPEVAHVYHTLSMLYYQMDDKDAAVELARKAIVVAERVVGVDSQETLLDYLNLALFLHQQGQSGQALAYAKHALRLWRVLYGADHPDVITTMNNAAVMLQSIKAYHESRRWFEASLRVSEQVFGRASLNSATLLFQLAQALALDQDSKAAVHRMRESYNVFLSELGPEDKNTKEAESWLEQLTQNAVSIAKHAKDVEARRLRAGIRFTTRGAAAGSVVPGGSSGATGGSSGSRGGSGGNQAGGAAGVGSGADAKGAGAAGGKTAMDPRSIDELIRFIEGSDGKKKAGGSSGGGSGGSKKRANPKRRGNNV